MRRRSNDGVSFISLELLNGLGGVCSISSFPASSTTDPVQPLIASHPLGFFRMRDTYSSHRYPRPTSSGIRMRMPR